MTNIRNIDYASQCASFEGINIGNCSPTDIDLFMEIGNKLFIIGEGKYAGCPVPMGQKLALERISDLISKTKQCVLIVWTHMTPPGELVVIKDCLVREFRYDGKWYAEGGSRTVAQLIKDFYEGVK